ncbi:hypothetical protein, variant 1 [Aphanomyces astaci]|uniref:Rho-GAP domain-containing protein n=2 Tax=Aphanomyces astaci TaxID=112090 RepID=W4H2U9_APHAT|nr:hypothetical protein, variant 1 [Aphanomyces astaci]ETV86355.1 hypothetical protein, variant 1 [Aphanomyces astaci]|eukprot:XP_009824829.1 hypothetical protein, variant 1 [Aphanomyces astaci]
MPVTWQQAVRKTSALLAPQRPTSPSNDALAKISEQAARLLTDLVAFVDMQCGNVAYLYRTDGNSSEVEELYLAFHRHLTTSTATFVNLHVFSPHAITSTIKKILRRYQPLMSYSVSQTLVDESPITVASIASQFGHVRATSRDVLRVLLCHWNRISQAKHMRMDVSMLAQCVGLLVVRPCEDTRNQRTVLKARQKVARKLIRGADTWQYTEASPIPSDLHSADKPLQYAVKVMWRPQDGVLYDEERLRAQLGAYGTVSSMALHPTEPKARVSMYWKKGSQLDKVVVKLQTKASLHVLRLQVMIPALKAVENTDDDDSSNHVTHDAPTTTTQPSSSHELPPIVEALDTIDGISTTTTAKDTIAPIEDDTGSVDVLSSQLPPKIAQVGEKVGSMIRDNQPPTPSHNNVVEFTGKRVASTQTNRLDGVDRQIQTDDVAAPETAVMATQTDTWYPDDNAKMVTHVRRVIEVLRTTTMAAADDMSSETIRAMHQAQVLVLRMLEGSVADQSRPEDTSMVLEYQRAMEAHFRSKTNVLEAEVVASQELLRMHKAQTAHQMQAWHVEMTACRVVALEADKQSADLREDLRACRSDLTCHLAMLSHLKRDNAALQEKLLVVEAKAQSLERDSEDQKDQVRTLHDVATKAQLRVEAYKRNASPCICDTGCVKQAGECTEKITSPSTAVDHLAQLKHEMSQRLQSQIDYTKATIDAMQQHDPTTVHLSQQHRTLSTLVATLVEGDKKTTTAASELAMEASRQKLNSLMGSFRQAQPTRTEVPPWVAHAAKAVQGTPPKLSKANSDSLNAARLALSNYHHVVGGHKRISTGLA